MDFNNILKQAQSLKEEFERKQKDFEKKEFEGTSGGGLVKVTLNGKNRAVALSLDEKLLDDKDVTMAQDLIMAAFNNAQDQVDEGKKDLVPDGMGGMPDISKMF